MLDKILHFSLTQRFLVILGTLLLIGVGWVSWKKPLPICLLGMCEAMARTGAPERLASYRPLIR